MTILRENGFSADGVFPGEVPDIYRDFLEGENLLTELTLEKLETYAAVIYLDCARRERASHPLLKEELPFPIQEFGIDHHGDNPHYCRDFSFVESSAAAASGLVFTFAEISNLHISPKAATFLLLGLVADCGCFRFDNTNADAFRIASGLMTKGADYHRIVRNCYFRKPENLLRLEGELITEHFRKSRDGLFIAVNLTPELLEKYHVDIRNTEQIIEIIRPLDGIKGCAVIRKEGEKFKASLRAKDKDYPVGPVARALGGGGHEMAAGCPITAPDGESAVNILFETVEKIWKKK
jgi:phosphoesterase RecJ-like protein